jgi:hypothetical protein
MRFVVKLIDAPAVPGGKAYALCDANTGVPLPSQRRCVVDNGISDLPTVTVEFAVNGQDVSLSE